MKAAARSYCYFLTLFLFLSCSKNGALDLKSYIECHQSKNYDSASLSSQLTGSWKWKLKSCFGERPPGKPDQADKDVIVSFYPDGSFQVKENGIIITTGQWSLRKMSYGFLLDLSQFSTYLPGEVILCDNELLMYGSAADGCDYVFFRT